MTFEYTTLEYRVDHAAEDIQALAADWARAGWCLKFILGAERVLVFERATS